jgi:precorrin-6A/cobalt-precorrin-6A reductase
MPRILILGGTTEARMLGERLAQRDGWDVTLSLAGRTASPVKHEVAVRIGGFGGAAGLADFLVAQRIEALIDATHPYATRISQNAAAAARQTNVPFIAMYRPPWIAVPGDRWIDVNNAGEAAAAIGNQPCSVFVTIGRNELAPFGAAPHHRYLIRSVDRVEPPLPLPHVIYLTARGPFREADDRALMQTHGIDVVVAKNSGGAAAYGKIAAARSLGIDVIMLRRPPPPEAPVVDSTEDAIAWLNHAFTTAAARGV